MQGGEIWFTDDGVWIEIRDTIESRVQSRKSEFPIDLMRRFESLEPMNYKYVVLKQEFVSANFIKPIGREPLRYYSNFFYGNDSSKWCSNVPNYGEVYYENIYNGIDLRYYLNKNGLKYDFIVHPKADVNQIRLEYKGGDNLKLDNCGNLIVKTKFENIIDRDLFIYQYYNGIRYQVNGKFVIYDNLKYGFEIANNYNRNEVLVIDPGVRLEYSTYIGGTDMDYGYGIEIDSMGYAYVTGITKSLNFPTTPGVNDSSFNGGYDIFVTKINPVGSDLNYSTYIGGGTGNDFGYDISIDIDGNAFVTGYTQSLDFPTTPGSYDRIKNGIDAFILKLNSDGSVLQYSTYIGGNSQDYCYGIAVDSIGNAFITGITYSLDFPTTPSANDTSYNGAGDIIIFKLNQTGSKPVYSTYIGGSWDDVGWDIALDSLGNAYVTGRTLSSDFPVTPGANDSSYNGGYDGFMVKLNQTGKRVVYSSYIGGSSTEWGYGITVDSTGNAITIGQTQSSNFPTSPSAYDTSYAGNSDVFILKLNQTGSTIIFSTFVGGSSNEQGYDIAVDSKGNIYATGITLSTNFPKTTDAYDSTLNGQDGFLIKLSSGGSTLLYSTYFGGNNVEQSRGIALNPQGDAYITGYTNSPDFPNTTGAFNRTYSGGGDAFVSKFSFKPIINITSLSLLKDNIPTNLIYSRLCSYNFKVNFIYTANLSDLGSVRLTLDPLGTNIQLKWDYSTGQFSKLSDPNNYVFIDPSSRAYNYFYCWTVDFNITFNWSYPDEESHDAQIYATSAALAPAWYNSTNLYHVENDLIFNGTLLVLGDNNRTILENSLVRGGEILKWTDLTPLYENTTDIYPPADEFDIIVWDETGKSWSDSPDSGQSFYTETITPKITYNKSFTYTVKLSDIPPESDRTEETFTILLSKIPPESDKTNETFKVKIDADNVTFSNVKPTNTSWQLTNNVLVSVNITDIGGGVVNSKSVMYSVSTNNGIWSEWKTVPSLKSKLSILAMDSVKLEEGKSNLIKWRAADSVGNGPTESEPYRILVDTHSITFSNPLPLPIEVSSTKNVELSIVITDATSGVDTSTIEYAVSENKGKTWSEWYAVEEMQDNLKIDININHTFPNGTNNRLKWRASDIAGNGPTESQPLIINVNTWVSIIKPKVTLLLPPIGTTINETSVELKWELEDKTMENVTYDLYFGNDSPPESWKTGISNTSFLVSDLKDGETYYWRVIPKLGDIKGTSRSDVWWFVIDLPKDSIIYKISLTGPKSISLFPGENKSIVLTITNLGTIDDMIKIGIETGKLSSYVTLNDYSMLRIDSKDHGQRLLNIKLPDTAQPGTYEIIITAISINSGEKEKDSHILSIEIKKPENPEPNGIELNDTEQKTNQIILFSIIAIIIIIILTITLAIFITKRKKRAEQELLPTGTITVKPGGLTAPVISVGEIPATLKLPQLPGTTIASGVQQPIPSPVPRLAKSTQIAQITTPQQTVQIPQLPQLPPAKIQEEKPEVSTTTPVPTIVSPPPTHAIPSQPETPKMISSQVGTTPKVTQVPNLQQGPAVHLPSSPTVEIIQSQAPIITTQKPQMVQEPTKPQIPEIPTVTQKQVKSNNSQIRKSDKEKIEGQE